MAPNLVKKLREIKAKSDHGSHKLSAVLLYKGRPLEFGYNSLKSDPKISKYSLVKKMHAEMNVIFKVKNKELLKDCVMVIYREDKQGNPANARSCEACVSLMKFHGMKHITYSTENGWVDEVIK